MSILTSDIFIRALIVGLLFAVAAGCLGTMVVVRRMAFFSDAIAHASLTGIALGLLLGVNPLWAIIGFSVIVGLGIAWLSLRNVLSLDTAIGVFYSAAVALGVIIITSLDSVRVNLEAFLFGDILAVTSTDVLVGSILAVTVVIVGLFLLGPLLQLAINRDLARVHGVRVTMYEFIFMAFLALTVAIGIKLVGVILVGALIIMPAATAKNLSRSYLGMLLASIVMAVVGVITGLYGSVWLASPSGPTIVLVMAVLFAFSLAIRSLKRA